MECENNSISANTINSTSEPRIMGGEAAESNYFANDLHNNLLTLEGII